jgi:hypothetical protein
MYEGDGGVKKASGRKGKRGWVRLAFLGLLVGTVGCAGSQPVQVQLAPGARIGILNLVEAQMTHIEMGALRFDSFTNVYPVEWDLPGYLTRRIESEPKQHGSYTFVPIGLNAAPGWNQSMAASIHSTVTTWLSGDLRRFIQQAAAENRLDLVVTVSSYQTGMQPPESCFQIYKSDLPTQGYGLFTRSGLVPQNQWLPVGGNKAHPYANILSAVFQTQPVALAAYGFAPCYSDAGLENFPWPADIRFLGPAQFDALRPAVEGLAGESVSAALRKAGLMP